MPYLLAGLELLTQGHAPEAYKLLLLAGWVCFAFLLRKIVCTVSGSLRAGDIAMGLYAASTPFLRYCGILQYEVPAAFCMLLLIYFLLPDVLTTRVAIVLGLLGSILGFFRVHFFIVFILALVLRLFLAGRAHWRINRRNGGIALGLFLLVSTVFCWKFSIENHSVMIFQKSLKLRSSLHVLSEGRNFPRTRVLGPAGSAYIWSFPMNYFTLLAKRFRYLTGLDKDYWYIEPGWVFGLRIFGASELRAIETLLTIQIFLSGLGVYSFIVSRRWLGLLLGTPIVVVFCTQLLINSSTRFLVPLVPFFCGWIAVGLDTLLRWIQAFLKPIFPPRGCFKDRSFGSL